MSKNTEALLELMIEENQKFEKLIIQQTELIYQMKNITEEVKIPSVELKTDRLEEIIDFWNSLFIKQKQQLIELNAKNYNADNKQRKFIYGAVAFMLIINVLKFL